MPLTLYSVSDGPPSLAVRQALKALNLDHKLVNVDFGLGEHMTEEYAKKNPQKEIPVLDDDGFYLSERNLIGSGDGKCFGYFRLAKLCNYLFKYKFQALPTLSSAMTPTPGGDLLKCICISGCSNAILQYLADKYGKDDKLYPKDLKTRAIVNQRLCFNLSTYYRYISEYSMAPIFFAYERTPLGLKKVHIALDNFNTYLERLGTKYAAADHVTIADFQLVTATMCLEAINFDFSQYPLIVRWYGTFKKEHPDFWQIVEGGMKEIAAFEKNPPDLSHMDHPIHPIRRK